MFKESQIGTYNIHLITLYMLGEEWLCVCAQTYHCHGRKEEKHLAEILRTTGSPNHIISSASRLRKRNEHEEESPEHTLCLAYVSGVVRTQGQCAESITLGLCLQLYIMETVNKSERH